MKPKYRDTAKLCYVDTDSFVINIKIEDFCEDIAGNVERWLTHLTLMKMTEGHFQ